MNKHITHILSLFFGFVAGYKATEFWQVWPFLVFIVSFDLVFNYLLDITMLNYGKNKKRE